MIALGAGSALLLRRAAPPLQLQTGTVLVPPRPLPDFTLIDERGRPFGPVNLHGHWSLIFFGYTNCPDFCPSTLTLLAAMEHGMREAHAKIVPQVVFMSVDAKRDTPAQLAQYVPYFDPSFIGITGINQAALERVARDLGVAVILHPAADGSYTVDHSVSVYVIDTEGRIAAILSAPFTGAALRSDFERIVASRV